MSPRKLIGGTDPYGFKPLCIGKRDNVYVLASESCALDTIGAEFIRDVNPGEIVTITKDGIQSDCDLQIHMKTARCIFEYIYFARPDSEIDGVGVYHSRIQAGRYPRTGFTSRSRLSCRSTRIRKCSTSGYSLESGIPYGTAFVKNGYVGRTFIKPGQSSRESSVQIKLNVLKKQSKERESS